MPSIQRNALVAYSASQMYELVNDVEKYENFLPGCVKSEVLESSDNHMLASMILSKAGVKQTLTTSNTLIKDSSIQMDLSDGPFKSLSGGWSFTPLSDDACKIELQLDFVFSSKLMEIAFGKIFNSLASNMVSAFSQRAKQVYG
ncbi:SRPBCC family protein [Brumicola nitratireducens]|uniref:Putative oligoketide cyclase/lipid transport protein n=1 Tax=Glaciecola nitratireducens (strain JCM 12485 / KCTC 12276 / FR1064) TaxID=1085623 RepID=G4QHA0_GLANF|nr:SRPBCC family protein [Glaciecola nitratireducens]AEP29731.1 putative oligoketide cyclase/lipid transport protein [Glaciecola nitratireducens FR1064]|tara:strand:- start:136 stop:567 length:432 start_codon:yes stop_codon:yes gene_type:complete